MTSSGVESDPTSEPSSARTAAQSVQREARRPGGCVGRGHARDRCGPVLPPADAGHGTEGEQDEGETDGGHGGEPSPALPGHVCESTGMARASTSVAVARATSCRPAWWSSARAARCCSCTVRSTTTGRSPRASSTAGERAAAAAVREVEEETGLRVRLGPPLAQPALPGPRRHEDRRLLDRPARRRPPTSAPTSRTPRSTTCGGSRSTRRARVLTYPHDVDTLDEALAAAEADPDPRRAPARAGAVPEQLDARTTGCARSW